MKVVAAFWEAVSLSFSDLTAGSALRISLAAAGAFLVFILFIYCNSSLLIEQRRRSRHNVMFPPGPFAWPIIGCLPSVGFQSRHVTFFRLSQKYGPAMHIRIGGGDPILVHSPELAMEALKMKDAQFCSRPLSAAGKYIGFDYHTIDLSPYNANWRLLRKLVNTELLSTSRLNMQSSLRKEEIMAMVSQVLQQSSCTLKGDDSVRKGEQNSQLGSSAILLVNMKKVADDVVMNVLSRMLFGKRYMNDSGSVVAKELKNFEPYVREILVLMGELNLGDLIPFLARFDLQGFEGRYQKVMDKVERLFQMIIDDHKTSLEEMEDEESKDVIHVLLSQKGENELTTKQIMALMMDILVGGLDTTSKAIEWTMAELVANPHIIRKAQQEIIEIVDKDRFIEEDDMVKLPYLQAVVKESLRLHPPVPINNPHLNESPTMFGGYNLPANSIIFVNIWGLGRDPKVWENPLEFSPERFVGSEINVHGNHFQLLPFSAGRRKCPTSHMATPLVQYIVAALLHCFEWAPPLGMSPKDIDLSESDGIVCGKKVPLIVRAMPCIDVSLLTL